MSPTPAATLIKVGLFALPAYGLLIGYTTLKPQPDQASDPEGWARFVSSTPYLVDHIISNVLGTALVIFGTFALGAFLAASGAPRFALWGMVLSITGYVLFTVPGVISTFATPAIGLAYLAGNRQAMALQFSSVLAVIIVLALALTVVGNGLLSVAIWRGGTLPRWSGVIWAAATLVFYVFGAALGMATTGASLPTQPIGGVLIAIAGAWIAWAAVRQRATESISLAPQPLVRND